MTASQHLPGLNLLSPQEEHDMKVQKAFEVISRDYNGDVRAYFDRYFAKQHEAKEAEETKKWAIIQQKLLERQAVLSH